MDSIPYEALKQGTVHMFKEIVSAGQTHSCWNVFAFKLYWTNVDKFNVFLPLWICELK